MDFRIFLFLISLCIQGILSYSYAASPLNQATLNQIDPGLLTKQLLPALKKQQVQASHLLNKASSEEKPFEGNSDMVFVLKEVIIRGNKAFQTEQLMAYFKPYLNKTVALSQVVTLKNQITELYRSKGYLFSKAILPPQTIKNGILQVDIVEGYINNVSVEGNVPTKPKKQIHVYTKDLAIQRPAQSGTIERSLLLVNDIPGITAQGVIKASENKQHASELKIITEYQPIEASAAYDNFGSRYFGPQEFSLTASLNSFLIPGGTLKTLALSSADPKALQYINAQYEQLLGQNGLQWMVGGAYSDTHPGFNLTDLEIHGISKNYFTSLTYPFLRSQRENFSTRLELNYLDSISTSFGSPMYFDRVRSMTLGMAYDNIIAQGQNSIDVKLTRGFNALGAENGGNLRSRAQGVSDFKKLNVLVSRDQFFSNGFSLYGLLHSQYTHSSLLASEEFAFGGASLGRGFEPADLSGDQGIAGTLELRLNTYPSGALKAIQYYAFCDSGTVWNLDRDAENKQASATSAGLGARLDLFSHVMGKVFVAKPVTNRNTSLEAMHHNSKAASIYFQLMTYF